MTELETKKVERVISVHKKGLYLSWAILVTVVGFGIKGSFQVGANLNEYRNNMKILIDLQATVKENKKEQDNKIDNLTVNIATVVRRIEGIEFWKDNIFKTQ